MGGCCAFFLGWFRDSGALPVLHAGPAALSLQEHFYILFHFVCFAPRRKLSAFASFSSVPWGARHLRADLRGSALTDHHCAHTAGRGCGGLRRIPQRQAKSGHALDTGSRLGMRFNNYNSADGMYGHRMQWLRSVARGRASDALQFKNALRDYRNVEAYTFNAANTDVTRTAPHMQCHDRTLGGDRFEGSYHGQPAGKKSDWAFGLDVGVNKQTRLSARQPLLRRVRLNKITGTSPTATSASDGSAASPRRSSRASW